jgi:hypothetical protein
VFSAADGGGEHYIIASGAAYRSTAARKDGFLFMAIDLQDTPNQLRHALTRSIATGQPGDPRPSQTQVSTVTRHP